MNVLVSLRALAKEARPKASEIKLKITSLKVGWKQDGANKHPIIKNGNAEYTTGKGEGVIWATRDESLYKLCKIWRWDDYKDRTWLIVAPNQSMAKERAMKKVQKRVTIYKGLAKTAISLLLKKTGSRPDPTKASPRASDTANRISRVTKSGSGSEFNIQVEDLLDYAKLAFKGGGDSAINLALMKAANKIVSIINKKCEKLLLFEKLDTPFPEVKQK